MPTQTTTSQPDSSAASQPFATIDVPTEHYLAVGKPERIKQRLSIALSSHSYSPRIDDLQSDWVAHVAAPAFKLFRRQRKDAPIGSFCSIGTGSGLDVLSAVEILGANRVGLTDVHEDVVATAADNISRNHLPAHPLVIEAGYGDLLEPLHPFKSRYDLIYENLPNVPVRSASEIAAYQKSSTHLAPRKEILPELVKNQMLDLHYLALLQAKDFLLRGGAVLSTLGARVPLEVFLALGKLAGYSSAFLTYTWKVQADPKEVIRDHANKQEEGFGPFYFYRADVLEKTFASIDISVSGKNALEIEWSLLPKRLDAINAYEALKKGERIGHTVAVLKSELI
jgi:methylase of polypeptide subunit release factors